MTIFDLIGNTPLVQLINIPQNKNVKIFGKLEGMNPGGSVKDRAAFGMIKGALDRGEIKQGDRLVEATSGNTGIALAMNCTVHGCTHDAHYARQCYQRTCIVHGSLWSQSNTDSC